ILQSKDRRSGSVRGHSERDSWDPEGGRQDSPGQRPGSHGVIKENPLCPERATEALSHARLVSPFQGWGGGFSVPSRDPGRCPGLSSAAPSGPNPPIPDRLSGTYGLETSKVRRSKGQESHPVPQASGEDLLDDRPVDVGQAEVAPG